MHENLANATFRIKCGESSGSGFSFKDITKIITNCHVVRPHLDNNVPIFALSESGHRFSLNLLSHSQEEQYDFAILQVQERLPRDRQILLPRITQHIPRGTEIIFSGFPHGIHDLLVQEAIVSGPAGNIGFYIDGSVNGGNSGGPIVEKQSGNVIGIVTQRRFLGVVELDALSQHVNQLAAYCQAIAGRGSVAIMGINFGQFAGMMAQGFMVIDDIIKANANSGLGIGFRIEFVDQEYTKLGMTSS